MTKHDSILDKGISKLTDRFPRPIHVTQDLSQFSDLCLKHICVTSTELRKLHEEQNPSLQCAVCDGYNNNCPEYSSMEEKNY